MGVWSGCLEQVCTQPTNPGRLAQGLNQGTSRCCGNPEEGGEDPAWSTRVGFLEEGTTGAKSLQDRDESCASQREGGSPREALKMVGCLSQCGWGEQTGKLLGVGEIKWTQELAMWKEPCGWGME